MSKEASKNNISFVRLEKEKPYGIYFSEWDDVADAVQTFAQGDFQMIPLSREEVETNLFEQNAEKRKTNTYSELELQLFHTIYLQPPTNIEKVNKNSLLSAKQNVEEKGRVLLIDFSSTNMFGTYDTRQSREHAIDGFAFYGKILSIEKLNTEKPYLITLHSNFFEDTGEKKLAEAVGGERAALPRNVIVQFGREEDKSKIDFDDVASRMKKVFKRDISGSNIANTFFRNYLPKDTKEVYALGEKDGLQVKMRQLNAYKQMISGPVITYLPDYYNVGIEYRPVALEVSVEDPSLTSRAYGAVNLVPPDKRALAQDLADKIHNAFTS